MLGHAFQRLQHSGCLQFGEFVCAGRGSKMGKLVVIAVVVAALSALFGERMINFRWKIKQLLTKCFTMGLC